MRATPGSVLRLLPPDPHGPMPLRTLFRRPGLPVGLLLGFLVLSGTLEAQEGTITGRVVSADEDRALVSATVELRDATDSGGVARVGTGFDGRFRIGGVAPGRYEIRISTLGYGVRLTEPFQVEAGSVYEFGEIPLAREAIALDPIEVRLERPAVAYDSDRTSYTVDAMAGVEGGSVQEALEGIPELVVDLEGRVEMQGEEPAIWINGRPAPVSGASLSQFLEQFPAELIDRIEVIENPGAEFDAEGTGGIVNIVLREGVELGLSGGIFVNLDTRGNTGIGGRGTLQRGGWTLDGSTSLRRRDSEVESRSLRQNLASPEQEFLEREAWNGSESLGGDVGLQVTFQPRDEARLWVRGQLSSGAGERTGRTHIAHLDRLRDPFLAYDRLDLREEEDRSVQLRTGFEWIWEPRRHVLDVELRARQGRESRAGDEFVEGMEYWDEAGRDEIAPPDRISDIREESDHQLRADLRYRRPLDRRTLLQTGGSVRWDEEDSDRSRVHWVPGPEAAPGPGGEFRLPLQFQRTQLLSAAWVTVEREVAEGISAQAGVRGERLSWTLDPDPGEGAEGQAFHLFPSASLSWRMDAARRLRLSYSQRIGRPRARHLDPTDRSAEPLEREIGNPDLEPRRTHRVALNASWTGPMGTLSVGPYYSRSLDGFERITTVDPGGISTRSWDNLAGDVRTGGTLSLRLPRRGGWQGSMSVSGSRVDRDADNLDARYSGASTAWNARGNLNGPVVGPLTGQARLRYRAGGRSVQGWDGAQASVDLSFRMRFLENRASATLALQDPFALQRTESEIRDLTVWELRESTRLARGARLSLSYALGGGGAEGPGRRAR